MATEETIPVEGGNDESTKRTRSPQKLPNDRHRKKQNSFFSKDYEDELEAKVQQMGLLMEMLDDTTKNAIPALNKNTPTPQKRALAGASVNDSDITGV